CGGCRLDLVFRSTRRSPAITAIGPPARHPLQDGCWWPPGPELCIRLRKRWPRRQLRLRIATEVQQSPQCSSVSFADALLHRLPTCNEEVWRDARVWSAAESDRDSLAETA